MEHQHRCELTTLQPVSGEAFEYDAGFRIEEHAHRVCQLAYAVSGAMSIVTTQGAWIVPPERAVWIPSHTRHRIEMISAVSMRTVFVIDEAVTMLHDRCRVVSVSELLRALILATIALPRDYGLSGRTEALVRLLLEEICDLDQVPLFLREPVDPRLLTITDGLRRNPADNRPLQDWAKVANASERTITRLFLKQTGLTFGQWRQQFRLITAIGMLARGVSVTVIAMHLGYSSSSAFSYMFRCALGISPLEYFGRRQGRSS